MAQGLAKELAVFLFPLLVTLDRLLDKRLVGQLAIGLQTRTAAPEPARRRRGTRSRRRRRLPFHTKGVGLRFQPSIRIKLRKVAKKDSI